MITTVLARLYCKKWRFTGFPHPRFWPKKGDFFAEELNEQSAIPAQEWRFFARVFNVRCGEYAAIFINS
jgi:hypothetical protein